MKLNSLALFCLILTACETSVSNDYRLKYVQDGDSAVLCCDEKGKQFTVRLKDIDAPEKHQPFAKESKNHLKQLIDNEPLFLIGKKKDRYGRRLVDIIVNETSVNTEMIKTGHAWLWRYSDNLKLQWLQKQAKKNKRGLWALPESQRIEPWNWRKKNPRK
ncbi:thermonuclease family protein [Kangiella sp. HZ709]|uniref:thermonuclease family protein n=1 Tax=Kangiella sp. HZ709 TaxID=2666328 RepID=UPI0012B0FA10|nr:thermonuclease family protein [Kangiella sp. HZ709]MRX27904.1 thermonuclease family protein [Kangiella sp. HZ709]